MSFEAKIVAVLVILGLGTGGVVASIETVDEGHEKVVLYKGEAREVFEPGDWYFINPLTQATQSVNTRPQKMEFVDNSNEGEKKRDNSIKVITSDDVRVPVNFHVTFKVTDSKKFYETWKTHDNFRARALYPGVEDAALQVGGGTPSDKIATDSGRTAMREAVKKELAERVNGTGATIVSVSVRKVKLPDEITDAASEAQAKEQELEAKRKEIKIARKEAKRQRIEAKGDRDAMLIRAQAYRKPGVIEAMYIKKLDKTDTVYIPVGEKGLPKFINATSGNRTASNSSHSSSEPMAGGA